MSASATDSDAASRGWMVHGERLSAVSHSGPLRDTAARLTEGGFQGRSWVDAASGGDEVLGQPIDQER